MIPFINGGGGAFECVLPFALGKCSCASTFHNNKIIGKGVLTLAINLFNSERLLAISKCVCNKFADTANNNSQSIQVRGSRE